MPTTSQQHIVCEASSSVDEDVGGNSQMYCNNSHIDCAFLFPLRYTVCVMEYTSLSLLEILKMKHEFSYFLKVSLASFNTDISIGLTFYTNA